MARPVYVDFRTEGISFACRGIVRDARTRQKIAEAEGIRPHGFTRAALDDARAVVAEHGWTEVEPNRADEQWDNVT